MNKQDLISKIKQLEGLTDDERAELVNLLNTDKKYGLLHQLSRLRKVHRKVKRLDC